MHLSDTLVLGPLPLQKHPIRLSLRSALAGLLALLLGGVAILLTFKPLPARVGTLAAHLPGLASAPTPAPPASWFASIACRPAPPFLEDGQVLGTRPMTVAVPAGHSLLLPSAGTSAVTVLDARPDLAIPVWPAPTVLAVRAAGHPAPGGRQHALSRAGHAPWRSPADLVGLPNAPLEGSWSGLPMVTPWLFLVRTTPTVLASLDLADGALRSRTCLPPCCMAPERWRRPAGPPKADSHSSRRTPRTTRHSPRRQSSHARR